MYLSMAMPAVMKMEADMEMVIPGKRKCGKRIMCTDVVSRKLFRKLSKIDPTRYPAEKKKVDDQDQDQLIKKINLDSDWSK